MSNNMLS